MYTCGHILPPSWRYRSMNFELQTFGCQSAISSVSINLSTNITELYRKRPTVFKFGCFEVNLSRSSGIFYRAIQKSEETLPRKERTRRQQTFYHPWRKPLQRLLFFSKLIILQLVNPAARD